MLVGVLGIACHSAAPHSSKAPTPAPARIQAPEERPRQPVAPPVVADVPRVLLGRVPGTTAYRVIACSRGPDKRDECSKELEARGTGIARLVELKTGDGGTATGFELKSGGGPVVSLPADAPQLVLETASIDRDDIDVLKNGTRKISPLPKWATSWSFEAAPFLAGNAARVAVTHIVDKKPNGSRELHGVWVALGEQPFELVDISVEAIEPLGRIDLDADGNDEFLFLVLGPMDGAYDYRLQHVIPGKRLAMAGPQPSEAWQVYDRLEDHNHSDE